MHPLQRLYDDLLNESAHSPLSKMLLETLRLATELGDEELKKWVELEINGYYHTNPEFNENSKVPEYRTIAGQYYDNIGLPLQISDPDLSFLNSSVLRNGISELEQYAKKEAYLSLRDPSAIHLISQHLHISVRDFMFSPSSVENVLTGIRAQLVKKLYSIRPAVNVKVQELLTEGTGPLDPDMHQRLDLLNGLHPTVVATASKLYRDGHYRQAILDTYIALGLAVKTKSARHDLDGSPLMNHVFSQKNPVLKVSDDADERLGFMWLFTGAVMGIRNPKAHSLIPQTDPQAAFEWLAFASALFRTIDKAIVDPQGDK